MSAPPPDLPSPWTIRARWVLPVDQPPIENGTLTVEHGRIVAVEAKPSRPVDRDWGDVVLTPAFVNAHTHLEFSDLKGPLGETGMRFPAWIRLVVARRRELAAAHTPEELAVQRVLAIEAGLAGAEKTHTAFLGEIASPNWPQAPFAASPLGGIIFQELIGFKRESIEPQLALARAHLASELPERWRPGLSPHAPYTIHPELLTGLVALSRDHQIPLAMHLAESPEELELLATQTGPFRELLEQFGAWQDGVLPPGMTPLDYLRQLAESHSALVIHGNYLTTEEIAFLAQHRDRLTLVYCPRTHVYFEHAPFPLAEALRAGVAVAIGTDSQASSRNLNPHNELVELARRHPDVSSAEILRLGTLAGAQALGCDDLLGSLTPGKLANLAWYPSLFGVFAKDPHDFVVGREKGSPSGFPLAYWPPKKKGS